MTGTEVKAMIKDAGLYCWQVAYALNMHDSNFSRKLRKPLTASDVEAIKNAIASIKATQA